VDPQNPVSIRTVRVDERTCAMWIIEDGVLPGERVVAVGMQLLGSSGEGTV
jgi:hypothetical protein